MNNCTVTMTLCCCLLMASALLANASFPEINEQEQDAFVSAVRKAGWSDDNQRRTFEYQNRLWFISPTDLERLAEMPCKYGYNLANIEYIRSEMEGNKIQYFYKQIRYSGYLESNTEELPFIMYTEEMGTQK